MALIRLSNQSLTDVTALPTAVTSSGVYLGGTGAANYLDDYEEGTWTPTNVLGMGGFSGSTSYYTKVGNIVFLHYRFALSSITTNMEIGGLPFTSASRYAWMSTITWNSPVTLNYQEIQPNTNKIHLNVAATWSGNQRYIYGTSWYQTS